MLVYLNGCNNCNNDGQMNGWLQDAFKNIQQTVKKLAPPKPSTVIKQIQKTITTVKTKAQQLVDQAKAQARKLGYGVQRIAAIPQKLANKAALRLIETNFIGLATRIRDGYRVDPNGLKAIVNANKISWTDFKNAVNKGVKNVGAISGMGAATGADTSGGDTGGSTGPSAGQYEAWTKAGVGIIKQIIEWFKKLGKKKPEDDAVVAQMATEVDADPTIPKFDESGNLLPNADGSFPPEKETSIAPLIGLTAAGIAAKALLFS